MVEDGGEDVLGITFEGRRQRLAIKKGRGGEMVVGSVRRGKGSRGVGNVRERLSGGEERRGSH